MLAPYFYQVDFESNAPSHIIENYKAHSLLFKSNKVVSVLSLKNRFEKDKIVFKTILGSFGYFDASTFYTIEKDKNGVLLFHIQLRLGSPFRVDKLIFSGVTLDEEKALREMLRLKKGKIFTEDRLLAGLTRMTYYFKNTGYPFIKIDRPKLRLLFNKKAVEVYFSFQKGEKKYFGDADVQNLEYLRPSFVVQKLTWKKGDLYDQRLVESVQRTLVKSGVIGYAHIKPIETENDLVPMRVKVHEAPRRTFLGEAGYSTSKSLSGRATWKHRNLLGNAESIEFDVRLSKSDQSFQIKPKIPYFIGYPDISVLGEILLSNEDTTAYTGRRGMFSIGLEKDFGQYVTLGTQIAFDIDRMEKTITTRLAKDNFEDINKEFKTQILSTPLYFLFNRSNNDLDPTMAFHFNIYVEPHFILEADKETQNFIRTILYISHAQKLYKHPANRQKIILYNKFNFGNIWGISRNDLIPHKRFYLGGTQTMRAYGEKKIGKIDDLGNPYGGVSFFMWIAELRFRFKNSMGINLYNEIGFVSEKPLWVLEDKDIFKGTGASFVYYSRIGPIQFGITLPWGQKRRFYIKNTEKESEKEIKDQPFQLYVGIGQI